MSAVSHLVTPEVSPDGHSLVTRARALAAHLLADDLVRLAHVHSAAAHAGRAAALLSSAERHTVVAAAWLHDIGYASAVVRTGFHPLDGALHLADDGWPDEVVRLVAHHSLSRMTAPYFGVAHHLAVIEPVAGAMSDVLVYADVVSGRDGVGATPERRIADMRRRHARGVPVPASVREARYRLLLATAHDVAAWPARAAAAGARPSGDASPGPA